MSPTDFEAALAVVRAERERKQREVRRKILQNDMPGAQFALGGELACEELERKLLWERQQEHRRVQSQLTAELTRIQRKQARRARRSAGDDPAADKRVIRMQEKAS